MTKFSLAKSMQYLGLRGTFRDILASFVVFLVALPLCLGIAVACGVPPAMGLITGIIGGLVTSSLAGCRLQVSGPAAGLTVLVFDIIEQHGLATLGLIVFVAGIIQVLAGFCRLGKWFRAVSPAVLQGMLAGIGVLICLSQFHIMLDCKPHGSGLPNLFSLPESFSKAIASAPGTAHFSALLLGIFTLAVLFAWKHWKLDKKLHLPGALPAVAGATFIAWVCAMPVNYVLVPDNIFAALSYLSIGAMSQIFEHTILLAALTMALIASAETLLSASAVDQLHTGPRTHYDRELIAQGVGNMLCGFVGSLPMTGVIARSTVNIEAGAQSRLSGILHGLWLLIVVLAIPFVLDFVPTSALAALLVYTGIKLVDLSVINKLKSFGHRELLVYFVTLVIVVCTDLLTGVLIGLLLALTMLVWNISQLSIKVQPGANSQETLMTLGGTASFLSLPLLAEALDKVPAGHALHLDFKRLVHIDHACLDLLENWQRRQAATGGKLAVDWLGLKARFQNPARNTI